MIWRQHWQYRADPRLFTTAEAMAHSNVPYVRASVPVYAGMMTRYPQRLWKENLPSVNKSSTPVGTGRMVTGPVATVLVGAAMS